MDGDGPWLPCQVILTSKQTDSKTWLVCVTHPLPPDVAAAVAVPFVLWDPTSVVAARSFNVSFTFPYIPAIFSITGCASGASVDEQGRQIATGGCPTRGGPILTLTGRNFFQPMVVLIGGSSIPVAFVNANHTIVTVSLPPGTGVVSVQVFQVFSHV